MEIKLPRESKILLISLAISLGLFLFGILSGEGGVIGNVIILSTFIIVTPQLILRYEKFRRVKEIEEKFPLFLRDLTEAARSGVALHRALQSTSKVGYGELSKEIKKMSNQISWGMTLDKVLEQFSDRVKQSKRLFTATKIIIESYNSGGDIATTLESLADNSYVLEDSEKERTSLLSQYVLLMYAISFIFIVIVIVINRLLIPIFNQPTTAGEFAALTNPCNTCLDFSCAICGLFSGTAKYLFALDPTSIASYYVALFFFMSLIQSIFSGLVAGQISENSVTAGLKHSLILTAITFGSFYILTYLKLLGG